MLVLSSGGIEMTSYDIPRGNGKTLDDIILELEGLFLIRHYYSKPTHLTVKPIIDDLKELSKAMEESK